MINYLITSLYKDKYPLELIADLFIAFMFILIVSLLGLQPICGGWDEGSGFGTCTISHLDDYYSFVMVLGTMFSFTGIVWIWFIPIALILKVKKIIKLGLIKFPREYPIDTVIYIPVIGLFLFLLYIVFI